MPHYYIWTIGCQMNKAESERLGSILEQRGYQSTTSVDEADVIILNSCVVRQSAEDRVVNKLHSLTSLKKTRPDTVLAVTGCLVNSHIDGLKKTYPQVDYFFKPGANPQWIDDIEPLQALPHHPSICTYIPIIQGCNNFCSYCIVPYRRGREISRSTEEIVCEVKELVARGTREITLLGQNVDSYGHDLPGKPCLADLLYELNGIEGLLRIRFLTNHPKDMSTGLIEAIAALDKVCEQISIPVQSGSNDILQSMRRNYTVEEYCRLIQLVKSKIQGVALSNDVIVGYPSETGEQFQQTVDLLTELRFDTVHIAAYSPREGTIAARELEDNVPIEEKKRRLEIIEKLQEKITTEINASLLNETVEVLVEAKNKGKWQGRTRTDKLVFFSGEENYAGRLVPVRIIKTSPWSLQGKPVS